MTNKKLLTYSILILATLLAYINTANNGFVYDDVSVIKKNRYLTHIENIKDIFSKENYFARSGTGKYKRYGEGSYRPIVTLTYFLDQAVSNKNPVVSHSMNLFYHLIQVLLIFNLILLISNNRSVALITALIFAVHPAGAEAINSISFREDILCSIFLCSSLYLYIIHLNKRLKTSVYLLYSIVFYLLACFSKENAGIFPLIILCYNHLIYNSLKQPINIRSFKKFSKEYIAFSIALIGYVFVRFFLFTYKSPAPWTSDVDIFLRITRGLNLLPYYIRLIIFPDRLSPAYNEGFLENFSYLPISIPVLLFVMWLITKNLKKKPIFSFSLIWLVINFIPVSGISELQHPVAERYLYLPMIGLIWFITLCFISFFKKHKKVILILIIPAVIILTTRTNIQNAVWKSEFSLWDYTIKLAPKNYNTQANYAVVLANTGRLKDAVIHYKKAIEIDNRAQSHYNLANTYSELGLKEKAKEEYRISIKLDPNYSEAHNNYGKMLAIDCKYPEAIKEIELALMLNPYNAKAFNNLGACYNNIGNYEQAIKALKKAIRIHPNYINAQYNIGTSYYKIGDYDNAEKTMLWILKVKPKNKVAKQYLSSIRAIRNNPKQNTPKPETKHQTIKKDVPKKYPPIKTSQKKITKTPSSEDLLSKSNTLMDKEDYLQALQTLRRAKRHDPDNIEIMLQLGKCYIKLESFQIAKKEYTAVLQKDPDNKEAQQKIEYLDNISRTSEKE